MEEPMLAMRVIGAGSCQLTEETGLLVPGKEEGTFVRHRQFLASLGDFDGPHVAVILCRTDGQEDEVLPIFSADAPTYGPSIYRGVLAITTPGSEWYQRPPIPAFIRGEIIAGSTPTAVRGQVIVNWQGEQRTFPARRPLMVIMTALAYGHQEVYLSQDALNALVQRVVRRGFVSLF